jgi:enamine deaminase RidA (YjgF/YER057c/UK114 family)
MTMNNKILLAVALFCTAILFGCATSGSRGQGQPAAEQMASAGEGAPAYFLLRPEVEKAYGYSHAVKIGADIKISGAVSMDDQGNPTAVGDLEQQMKNAYSDLDKVLRHYGYTFDDVLVENVYTTDMARFLEVAAYRNSIYTKQFPTGTWLEVKGLALPEFMIEIELEAHKAP